MSPSFAERARAKRAGFVEADDEQLRKLGKRPVSYKELHQFYRDDVEPILLVHRYHVSELNKRNETLEARCQSLETRLLEVEFLTQRGPMLRGDFGISRGPVRGSRRSPGA